MRTRTRTGWMPAALLAVGLSAPALAQDATQDDDGDDLDAAVERTIEATQAPEVVVIGRRAADGVPVPSIREIGSRDVFGPERVRETGARDLNDLVVNIPALSSRPYNGGEAAAPSFSMRGLPDDGLTEYIHVLIDGVPASPMPYGWTAFSFLPVTTERVYAVDFIRGAHAVRYSPNTVGGVLNFITQPIPDGRHLTVRSTFGSFDYRSTLVSAGGTDGRFGVLASLVTRSGDGYRDDASFDQEDLNLKMRLELWDNAWIATSISKMDSEHFAPGGLTLAEFDDDEFANARPRNRFDGSRTVYDVLLHSGMEKGWIEGFAYYSDTFRNLIAQRPHFGVPATLLDWTDHTKFLGVGFRANRTVDILGLANTFHAGARLHEERLPSWTMRSTPFAGGPTTITQDTEFAYDTWSAHIDDTIAVTDALTVTVGGRLERARGEGSDDLTGLDYDESYSDFLPGAGASYAFGENAALFANAFESFRAPQVWGFGSSNPANDLEFETGTMHEIGFRFRRFHGLSGAVTRWRTDFEDVGVFYSGFYENLGDIRAEGVDAELEADVGAWITPLAGLLLRGSVTRQDSELKSGPNDGMETPYAWETKAAWSIRYETADAWVFSLGGTYVGESFADELNTTIDSADGTLGVNPSRTLWDARVSKSFQLTETARLEVAVGGTNLLDNEWFVHSRGGFFGGGKVAGPPRQAYLSIGVDVDF